MRRAFSKLSSSRAEAESYWHAQLMLVPIESFAANAYDVDAATAAHLRGLTDHLVAQWQRKAALSGAQLDEQLGALVHQHVSPQGGCLETALLACVHAVTAPAAIQLLSRWQPLLLPETYLWCLLNAERVAPGRIPPPDLQGASSLRAVLANHNVDVHFMQLEAILVSVTLGTLPTPLLPLQLIDSAMEATGFRERGRARVDSLLRQRRFKSAYDLVSWLPSHQGTPSAASDSILDRHFPNWRWFLPWEPNYQRARLWEEDGALDGRQREKLQKIFDLEAPDTNGRLPAFKFAEPACYALVPVRPRDLPTLERVLELLDQAISCGKEAVDLFIHLCVNTDPGEAELSTFETAVADGAESCLVLGALHEIASPDVDLFGRLEAFTLLLTQLTASTVSDGAWAKQIATAAENLLAEGQMYFCAQLDGTAAEPSGLVLFGFASALAASLWLHSSMDPEIVMRVKHGLPPPGTLKDIFQQLKAFENPYAARRGALRPSGGPQKHRVGEGPENPIPDGCGPRLKDYLRQSLGGQGGPSVGMAEPLQLELRFWTSHPGASRMELAHAIDSLATADYELFTACLSRMLKEDEVTVGDLLPRVRARSVHALARLLSERTERRLKVDRCWISLLGCLFRSQDPSAAVNAFSNLSAAEVLRFIDDIGVLLDIDRRAAVDDGSSTWATTLAWWRKLGRVYRKGVEMVLSELQFDTNLGWLLVDPTKEVVDMLDAIRDPDSLDNVGRRIPSFIKPDGANIRPFCQLVTKLRRLGHPGTELCSRVLDRQQQKTPAWSPSMLNTLVWALNVSRVMPVTASTIMLEFSQFIGLSPLPDWTSADQLLSRFVESYEATVKQARSLHRQCAKLKRRQPGRISQLLASVGVQDDTQEAKPGRLDIPESLADVVDIDNEGNYEMCFPLTALSELQRKARGVPAGWRAVVARISTADSVQFCLHSGDDDDAKWNHGRACITPATLFTYHLKSHYRILRGQYGSRPAEDGSNVETLYLAMANLIAQAPQSCVCCISSLAVRVWKPATCGPGCSKILKQAHLGVRLHQLLADPLALDLLLTTAQAAVADVAVHRCFEGCPVLMSDIPVILHALPPLSELAAAPDLAAALKALGPVADRCEAFLSWLCVAFRGFLSTAPNKMHVRAFPNSKQFVLLNSSPEHQLAAAAQQGYGGVSGGLVFHGTTAARLFPILLEGLKIMSGTDAQLHGAANGAGVYCGDEPGTSWPYSGGTVTAWRNSELANLNVLLACELSDYAPAAVHTVSPAERLLVRQVFLIPAATQMPARRHVNTQLLASFTQLRTGM